MLLDTKAASWFLKQQCGVSRSVKYLRKLRCTGGGPPFQYLNAVPYYTQEGLRGWLDERLSQPVSNTSQIPRRKPLATLLRHALGAADEGPQGPMA